MVGTNIFILLVVLVIALIVITLALLVSAVKRERESGGKKTGKSEIAPPEPPASILDDDISLSGGSLMDEPHLEGDFRQMDGKEDLLVSQSAPARKNGRPH